MAKEAVRLAQVPAPYEATFTATVRAVTALGTALWVAEPANGVIGGKTSANLLSWGEVVLVLLRDGADGTTHLRVSSSLTVGLHDWGRNARNVERILGALGAA